MSVMINQEEAAFWRALYRFLFWPTTKPKTVKSKPSARFCEVAQD